VWVAQQRQEKRRRRRRRRREEGEDMRTAHAHVHGLSHPNNPSATAILFLLPLRRASTRGREGRVDVSSLPLLTSVKEAQGDN
jgi:hypothetical protein